ncbi:hypothetical protein F5146DRAFT_922449 [Armillaria mellea]|nr:hypothetical protein F5146DRAFT_922449 [Armillaria mellea]
MTHGSRILHLPQTKIKQVKGENILLSKQLGITDPINAITNHITCNEIGKETPIASYLESQNKCRCITKSSLLKQYNNIWTKHGLERFTGHCFQIRGTIFYLIKGINPDIVKVLGWWKSDAFRRYWYNLQVLGILHTELIENREKDK